MPTNAALPPSLPLRRHGPLLCGMLLALLSAAGLILWHLQANALSVWGSHFWTMPHNAYAAFLLSGTALVAITLGAPRMATTFAWCVLAITLLSMGSHLFSFPPLFEGILSSRYGSRDAHLVWASPPLADGGLALGALALMLAAGGCHHRWRRRLLHVLAVAITGMAMLLLLFSPMESAGDMPIFSPGGLLQLILGHLLLGCGLLALVFRPRTASAPPPIAWIGTVAVLGQLSLTVLLWTGLEQIITEREAAHIEAESNNLTARFTDALKLRLRAIERMARRWEAARGTSESNWRMDATAYQEDISGFQALQWIDPQGIVRWIEPLAGNETALNLDNRADPTRRKTLERAETVRSTIITGPLDLRQGGQGLLLTRAIHHSGRSDGYLVAVFRTTELLAILTEELRSLNYAAEISLDGVSLYKSGTPPQAGSRRAFEKEFTFDEIGKWRIRTWPTEATIQRGPFYDLFLISGIAMTLMVAAAFWFWANSARAANRLHHLALELHAERNFVGEMIDSTNALSLVLDQEGRIVRFNRSCEELTGLTSAEAVGTLSFDTMIPPDQRAAVSAAFSRLFARGGSGRYDCDCLARGGETRRIAWLNAVSVTPHRGGRHMLCIGFDVTERQRTAAQLQAAMKEAERANRAKSEFLSSMSHELRTPMNAVLGFAQLIDLDPKLSEDHRESVRHILKAGELLLSLINDVLNLTRIESGRQQIDRQPVDCGVLVSECIDIVRPLTLDRHIALQAVLPTNRMARADRRLLKQVLINLLSNAIKYNREGGRVTLEIRSEQTLVHIAVRDTGIGIPEDYLPHLFRPFERHPATASQVEGTGIGLALSHRLVQAMGGTLTINSIVNVGSTLTVTLPALPCPTSAAAKPAVTEVHAEPAPSACLHG